VSCLEVGTILRLLTGELSPVDHAVAEEHLDGCEDCLDLVAEVARDSPQRAAIAASEVAAAPGPSPASAPGAGTPAPPPMLPERFGPFEIVRGRGVRIGGMSVVREARDTRTGELVAVKQVRGVEPAAVGALRQEIHALGRFRHPGVVRIIEQGTGADGLPWYAMELIEGETLAARIGRLPPRAAATFADVLPDLQIVRDLCQTLAFLHGEELVHRDLKPANVLIRPNGVPVLVDFGLASRRLDAGRELLEGFRGAAGTPGFVAPEQQDGDLVDARADLFALGRILYQILTGTLSHAPRLADRDARGVERALGCFLGLALRHGCLLGHTPSWA